MKRQRAIIQDMSKNIQRDILNKKIEAVDLSGASGLHVLNRNQRKEAVPEGDEDELKRFQKIANIYERHNYIKNQI